MARMTTELLSFADALAFLGGAESRKLGHNTFVHLREPDLIVVRYHSTDIIDFYEDGTIYLTTGGWMTTTTKQRLDSIIPGVRVYSEGGGDWAISTRRDSARFEDGVFIDPAGTFQAWKAHRWARRTAA